jgi:transcription antitermination factor NusG
MFDTHTDQWFAIHVRPNSEHAVLAGLRCKDYDVYLPTYRVVRRWSDRSKILQSPLFAGYLFCRFSSAASGSIVTTPGVIRILGVGNTPVAIDDSEITALQAIESCNGLRLYPWPRLEIGAKVCICDGPLRGVVGVLRLVKNQSTFIVAVPMLQRSVAIEVPAVWIGPTTPTRGPEGIDAVPLGTEHSAVSKMRDNVEICSDFVKKSEHLPTPTRAGS